MNLYIVDYHYHDGIEGNISDRWVLGCKDGSEVEKTMKLNFEQLKKYGFKPISYSFQKITYTHNDMKVSVDKV